ncbi:MAG TPA: polyprenyl synthetase family protein [Bacteroidia bacterium]|nr:polyprenyl synthetase family protein [Bacteroidia bacterium]
MQYYQPLLELFNAHLDNYIKGLDKKQPKELYDPENYILSLGGKRIRPLLCLIGCDLFDKKTHDALDAALCIELFHNFSLIHDDILDKAPLRRGQPSVHSKWNTNIAILSGDVMFAKAFHVLKNCEASKLKPLLNEFAKTSIEVCEGQQLDMNFENSNSVTVADYINMITNKTAVLLGCSLKMGAICADAHPDDANHIYGFGKHLGIAFQLMDDLLDVYAEGDNFGKQIGGDIIANKKTFLLLKAFELVSASKKEKILSALSNTSAEEKVQTVLSIYNELNIKAFCKQEADKHTKQAIKHLHDIKARSEKKIHLEELAHQLLNRQF